MAKAVNHIKDLRPDRKNARKHNPRNIGMIEQSLQEVGAARSIVIDEDNDILCGNGTIEAAGNVGITKVKVVDAEGDEIVAVRRKNLTNEQKQRLALFDNRTAELAEWDAEIIAGLQLEGLDFGGIFSQDEIDAITAISLNTSFAPTAGDEQGRLDEMTKAKCPECGHEFTP